MNLNNFTGSGRVVRDPEMRMTSGGKAVANFTIAINRKTTAGQDEATFLDCVAWEAWADVVAKYAPKGKHIGVVGELRTERWETPDGNARSKNVLVVQRLELYGAPAEGNATAARDRVPSKKGAQPDSGDIPF